MDRLRACRRSLVLATAAAVTVAVAGCGSAVVDPCGSDHLCIGLRVEGHQSDLDQLAVTIDNPSPHTGYSPPQPSHFALPAKLPLHLAPGTSGVVNVDVRAFSAGVERAHGHNTVTLDGSGHGQLTVTLEDSSGDLSPPPSCSADLAADPQNCGACGVSCASGLCGSVISASMAEPPTAWTLNGKTDRASYDAAGKQLVLTKNAPNLSASAIYEHALAADAFSASFDFRILWDTNPTTNPNLYYGDGLAFVIIRKDPSIPNLDTAFSSGVGAALGMVGLHAAGSDVLLSGYGVEFDTFDSDYMNPNGDCGELKNLGEHVNIDNLALCATIPAAGLPTPLATPATFHLSDGGWHHTIVRFAAGTLSVWIDADPNATPAPAPLVSTALSDFRPADGYFLGFTAATGARTEEHDLKNVTIDFGSPHCL